MTNQNYMTVAQLRRYLFEIKSDVLDRYQVVAASNEEGSETMPMPGNPELCCRIDLDKKQLILLPVKQCSKEGVYIRLFHGRADPNQGMDDWGSDGPIFGPYEFIHTVYGNSLWLGRPTDGESDELHVHNDLVFYGGVYYGDWTVFDEQTLEKSDYIVVKYDPNKASLPKSIPS